MHQVRYLRHVFSLLDLLPPVVGAVNVSEGASYLHPLRRLVCCLRLLPTVGQWSERVQSVATPGGVESILLEGAAAILGGCLTSSALPGFKFEVPA